MLSAVILNYNDFETTIKFVESIKEYKVLDHIIVVDNCSSDDSYQQLLQLISNKIDVISTAKNGGYGYGNNAGIRYAYEKYQSEYILISNPDVEVSENTVEHCLRFLEGNGTCGIVAPMMLNPDYKANYKCVWKLPTYRQYLLFSLAILGKLGGRMYYTEAELSSDKKTKRVGCVAGSFLMINTDKMMQHGMYDEHIFLYCEETVLGIKMKRAGIDTCVLLDDQFIHHHSVSINKSIGSKMKQQKLMWKSRRFVLENYYAQSSFKKSVSYIVMKLSLLETRLSLFKNEIRRVKGGYNEK